MRFPAFEPIDIKNSTSYFEIAELNLANIQADEKQARKYFDETLLDELVKSIKQHGVIQPVIVKRMDQIGIYQLIAGERRWRAAKRAGLETIPAIIKNYNKENQIAVSLVENIQRQNLNPLEEAEAIQRLLQECLMTHQQVAKSIGRSRVAVTNLLRLLNIEPSVKAMIMQGSLEMGHARALLGLSKEKQEDAAKHVINKKLSVRETEKFVQNVSSIKKMNVIIYSSTKKIQWEEYLKSLFSTDVDIHINDHGKVKIVIQYDSIDKVDDFINSIYRDSVVVSE